MKEKKMNVSKTVISKRILCLSLFSLVLLPTVVVSARGKSSSVIGVNQSFNQADLVTKKIKVSGVVTDPNGQPLVGATVTLQGSTIATLTDADGKYSLLVPENGVLHVTYMGYNPEQQAIKGKTVLSFKLRDNAYKFNDVVVTALGIKRQQRSLGYSTTDVKGKDFTEARDPNLGNALSGKVAGLSVTGNATGAGGSSRVVIRGNASLTGNNQPLYVIDGVPYDNTSLSSAGKWGGIDMGDGLSNINPDDIADIQVLKGAAASALYGYRGGNGAILITTKSGHKGQPVSIDFNNNLTFNTIYDYRDFQNTFGQGNRGELPTSSDMAKASETDSWGARMNGQAATNFLGQYYKYSPRDNWNNFYRTGLNNQSSLSVSGASDHIKYRFGLSNTYDRSILPNSDLNQQGINMNTTYDITSKLHLMVNANYVFEKSSNKSNLSDGNCNTNASLLYRANSFDVRWMKGANSQFPGTNADGSEMLAGSDNYFNNPYWLQYRHTNEQSKNRLTGGMTLKYDITKWLYVQGGVTRDGYNVNFKQIQPMGAAPDKDGWLTEYAKSYSEMNLNYLLAFNKKFGVWDIGATFGGNKQRDITQSDGADAIRPFLTPNFPSSNNIGNRTYTKLYSEYMVNSLYGTADVGFKNQVFLNLTGRNDWFSTLNPLSNHYFYPSVSLSWVFTDSFKLPEWFTFGKIRASYASASNGTAPYQNMLTYQMEDYKVDGQNTATVNNSNIPNKDLKPVRISEREVGLNLAFLDNRISLDAAVYDKKTNDDIAFVSTSSASGFDGAVENVGKVENRGVEVMLSLVPVKTNNVTWNSTFNFSYNNSKVEYLGDGVDRLSIDGAESRLGNVTVQNIVGQDYGQLVGYKYKRHNGQIVYKDGIAQQSDKLADLGSGVYKFIGGWKNDIKYKNITLSFLLDFKAGAKIFSGTNYGLYKDGLHKKTLQGRGYDGKGKIIGKGVMFDDKLGKYVPNNVAVNAEDYWQGITTNNIAEEFVSDASFIKLRELSLAYSFPKSILSHFKYVKGLTLSFVARNLWTILKYTDNIDPESAYNNSNGQGLELNGYPPTRNIGFNLNVKF